MTIRFTRTVPTLRIFDTAKAREFYLDFLGCKVDWEHRYTSDLPLFMQVSLGDANNAVAASDSVDVIALGHKLGEFRRIDDRHYREGGEARILECTAQSVRFQLIASGRYVTEPLDHVRVLYNEEKHRHALIVTGY